MPGYLIDPARLEAVIAQDNWTVKGTAGAVRPKEGTEINTQRILVLAFAPGSQSFRRDKGLLITSMRRVADAATAADGSLALSFTINAGERIYLKLQDAYADNELAFKPGEAASDRVAYTAGSFQAFTQDNSQDIAYDIDPQGTVQSGFETLKATRNCRYCRITDTDLSSLNLNGCNLTGSNVSGSKLSGVDMSNCVLQKSNLRKADLSGANLSGADLTGADLTEAILTNTVLTNVKGYSPP